MEIRKRKKKQQQKMNITTAQIRLKIQEKVYIYARFLGEFLYECETRVNIVFYFYEFYAVLLFPSVFDWSVSRTDFHINENAIQFFDIEQFLIGCSGAVGTT